MREIGNEKKEKRSPLFSSPRLSTAAPPVAHWPRTEQARNGGSVGSECAGNERERERESSEEWIHDAAGETKREGFLIIFLLSIINVLDGRLPQYKAET